MKKIAVVGAGYVGLVTAVCFASKGQDVIVVENNKDRINALLKGQVPIYEPGLDLLLQEALINKKISFVDHISKALELNPEIIFSCVGTPSKADGSADLSYVYGVAEQIGKSLSNYVLVVNKSTVPVGTAKKVKAIISQQIAKRSVNIEFDVSSNPEFLKEGTALDDFMHPDRVVVGVESEKVGNYLKSIYKPFLKTEDQFLVMNIESAELTKYASNAMLSTRISFMNQLARLSEKVGADIKQVQLGMSKDVRIGASFLNAGVGYGGSCFPKDVKALVQIGKENNEHMSLFEQVDLINNDQREWFANKILSFYKNDLNGKIIGVWGLAFKPETDDIRSAPSIDIVKKLLKWGAKIIAYDPIASENFKKLFGKKINYANTAEEVLDRSDALLLLTDWKEFLNIDLQKFQSLKDKVIFDGRNCFRSEDMLKAGVKYFGVGVRENRLISNFEGKFASSSSSSSVL